MSEQDALVEQVKRAIYTAATDRDGDADDWEICTPINVDYGPEAEEWYEGMAHAASAVHHGDGLDALLEKMSEMEPSIAARIAEMRTGNSVFMDNSHQPNARERHAARDIVRDMRDAIEAALKESQ